MLKEYCLEIIEDKDYKKNLALVREYELALEFIDNQTEELCLTAVKSDGNALEFIKKQTPEVCIEAIKQNRRALEYVKELTPEICLQVLKYRGDLLKYINGDILDKNEHFIFENPNVRNVYVNKIDGTWLFSVGCQNNITKEKFIERIHNNNGGLEQNPHRQIYLDFLNKF